MIYLFVRSKLLSYLNGKGHSGFFVFRLASLLAYDRIAASQFSRDCIPGFMSAPYMDKIFECGPSCTQIWDR